MGDWKLVLELNEQRDVVAGSTAALCDAVGRGADLRIGTGFHNDEHLDATSDNHELIREVMDFRVTYLIGEHWAAGIQNLRMPVSIPNGFGGRPSMSFFLYNQDGHQGIARPFLDGVPASFDLGPSPINEHGAMAKYHELASFDADTNAPSSNFIYNFNYFRYYVRDQWRPVLAHDEAGQVTSGSIDELTDAFCAGREMKVAIRGLCDDLAEPGSRAVDHEVIVHLGAGYYYTDAKRYMGAANPVIRTRPAIPLGYASGAWDFGWLMPRTDGFVAKWLCDPYKLEFVKSEAQCAMRWFAES